jgi:hypothetical protein
MMEVVNIGNMLSTLPARVQFELLEQRLEVKMEEIDKSCA